MSKAWKSVAMEQASALAGCAWLEGAAKTMARLARSECIKCRGKVVRRKGYHYDHEVQCVSCNSTYDPDAELRYWIERIEPARLERNDG